MNIRKTILLVIALFCAGCADFNSPKHTAICRRLSLSTPSVTSVVLTFRRKGSSADILVRLAWEPNRDPIYSPRGPMNEISVSEAGRCVSIPIKAIRANNELRTIEDLWPEYVELFSVRPGDYDLLLSRGVPAGLGATLVELRHYVFRSALPVTSAHLLP